MIRHPICKIEGGLTLKGWRMMAAASALITMTAGCGVGKTPPATNGHNAKKPAQSSAATVMHWSSPPAMTINLNDTYQAVVHTTAGAFTIQLFAHQDPTAVNNFVFLANQHFYDGNKFFRVLKSFVVQTGDPYNNGSGGPGYTWNAELPVPYAYQPGIVAMAVSEGNPNTNGSQFFICTGAESEQLNQKPIYTELGRVVKGWSTILKISNGAVTANPLTNEPSYPIHPYSITSISIEATPSTGS